MQTNQYFQVQPATQQNTRKPRAEWHKRTAAISRWLHTYLSMFSFIVVLFFAITGITLNHAEWFDGAQVEKKINGAMPAAWVNTNDTSLVKKLEVVEFLRNNYSIKGSVSDFLIDDQQCSLSFKGPGYSADAFINRKDGKFRLMEMKLGLVAVLNDLHKGRDTDKAWSWMIDVSAGFLTLVSLSGLVILFFLKSKRMYGILLAVAGGVIVYITYHFLVS
ncbi:MAG: PepSY-associated TM helix domain-containing protein [Chitinophagaceae bacterium]